MASSFEGSSRTGVARESGGNLVRVKGETDRRRRTNCESMRKVSPSTAAAKWPARALAGKPEEAGPDTPLGVPVLRNVPQSSLFRTPWLQCVKGSS